MVDFNGSGGLAGFNPFSNSFTSSPVGSMSANQINSSMGMGYGGAGDQSQALYNQIFGDFGKQTDYYSALGAAYGRATGGFGGYGGGANPSGSVQRGPDLPDLSQDPFASDYNKANPDVFQAGADPFKHWLDYGRKEGRDPLGQGGGADPFKDYLTARPDVAAAGVNPLQHWKDYGSKEMPGSPFGMDKLVGREGLANAIWNATKSDYGAPALTGGGGSSDAPPYQGNPYYMPQPMSGGSPLQGGGGFGAPGFGIGQSNYTGQPGFGLGIGQVGPGSVGPAYGTTPSGNPGYGFGGLSNGSWTPAYNAGGGLSTSDPGNVAAYWSMMRGGG